MTPEQITLLVTAIVAFLQVLSVAIGIWNKNHIGAVAAEQKRTADNISQFQADHRELKAFLTAPNSGTPRTTPDGVGGAKVP